MRRLEFLAPMPEFSRLNECSDWIEFDFVEREATPEPLMKLSIHLHAAELSLSYTVSILEKFGVERCRSTINLNNAPRRDRGFLPGHRYETDSSGGRT